MPFDLIAWYESQACAALTPCAGVDGEIYRVAGDDIFVKPRAPFLAGLAYFATSVATMKYSELRQPSLKIPYRSYRVGDLDVVEDVPAAFKNLFATPLPLYAGEKLNALVQNATDEIQLIIAWLTSGKAVRSALENVNPTHLITGYSDTTLTAGAFTHVPITWDQDLPAGRYAIVGMNVGCYVAATYTNGIARLKLLESTWRPGVLISQCVADKLNMASPQADEYSMGKRWPLMPEIAFNHDQMPNIEVLAGDALTDHVIDLLLVKTA